MFRLGLLSQIILPHPPDSPRDKLTTFSTFIHELKKSCADIEADLERRNNKVETGVNTDTLELIRQLDNGGPVMVDIGTQTPVEFYFHMDFDLYGSLEIQGKDGEDTVDGIDFIINSKLMISPTSAELLGMELREIADEYTESYSRKKEKELLLGMELREIADDYTENYNKKEKDGQRA